MAGWWSCLVEFVEGVDLVHQSVHKFWTEEKFAAHWQDTFVVQKPDVLGIYLRQNVAAPGCSDVVVEHCPQF